MKGIKMELGDIRPSSPKEDSKLTSNPPPAASSQARPSSPKSPPSELVAMSDVDFGSDGNSVQYHQG